MIPSPAKPTLSAIPSTPGIEHAHVPLHLVYKRVVSEHETASFKLEEQGMQHAVSGWFCRTAPYLAFSALPASHPLSGP